MLALKESMHSIVLNRVKETLEVLGGARCKLGTNTDVGIHTAVYRDQGTEVLQQQTAGGKVPESGSHKSKKVEVQLTALHRGKESHQAMPHMLIDSGIHETLLTEVQWEIMC